MRFYFEDSDPARRDRLARTTTAFVVVTTTAAGLIGVLLAAPLSQALLGLRDATLMSFGVLGLWAFTNSRWPTRCCASMSAGGST